MYIGNWQWLDFALVPGWLDWVAFVLGGAGIGFTILQLLRSKGALESARRALVTTQSTLIKNQLLGILPKFSELSHAVDVALDLPDRSRMDEALERFCLSASEAATLLEVSYKDFGNVVSEILDVVNEASEARSGLFGNREVELRDIAGAAASSIRNLAPRISGITASIRNDAGGAADA